MTSRMTMDEMQRLAASAIRRVDAQGARGVTLCTMDEITALAGIAALSGLLPDPTTEPEYAAPMFKTRRTTHD